MAETKNKHEDRVEQLDDIVEVIEQKIEEYGRLNMRFNGRWNAEFLADTLVVLAKEVKKLKK